MGLSDFRYEEDLSDPEEEIGWEDLTDEPEQEQAESERLQAFSSIVSGMVEEAVSAREASGIEQRWLEDMRQYYGGDWTLMAYNSAVQRAAEGGTNLLKTQSKEQQRKSKITVNITRPKTNAVVARLADMLLPTDDKNWGLFPTPIAQLVKDIGNKAPAEKAFGVPVQNEDGTEATMADVAAEAQKLADEACRGMEKVIEDQLIQCNYNGEFRKSLWDLGVLGTFIMRGPFVRATTKRAWTKQGGRWTLSVRTDESPASERVSPWSYYPDPACGGDIANARYHVEKIEYNERTLRELRDQPGFLSDQIVECLNEGPRARRASANDRSQRMVSGQYERDEKSTYEVFMVHGYFTKGQLEDAQVEGCECATDDERHEQVNGCVFLCNGRVIKAYLNPLSSAEMPYSVAVYEKIDGQVFGVGVPFVLRNPQRVVIAGWRMLMDNSALAGGVQVVVNKQFIDPADGQWTINGTKLWVGKEGLEDVRAAFGTFQVDSRINEIMAVIDRALRFGEDETSLPAIMEGSQAQAPQTVGVATVLTNSANTVLRRLVKSIDDDVTDDHITRYYDFNMEHHPDDSIKGDYQVDARGTSVLLVRDLQQQSLMMAGQFVLNPLLGRFHKRMGYDWLKSMYEAQHIDSATILVDDQEAQSIIDQMMQAPPEEPPPPQIAVAEIKASVDQAKLQATMEDRDRERAHDTERMRLEYQLEMIRYANEKNMKLEDVKTKMTELLMTQQHEQRMQEREISIKAQMGSGI